MSSGSSPVEITSQSHLKSLLSSHSLAVIDFHATWCGPCHALAPIYASLAQKYSQPGKIVFTKVDVDNQSSVAREYSVSAMPTVVLVMKGKGEVARIRGLDRSAITREVEKWAAEARKASGSLADYGKGYVLGEAVESVPKTGPTDAATTRASAGAKPPVYIRSGQASSTVPFTAQVERFFNWLALVIALYLTSLFSLDPIGACESMDHNAGLSGVFRGFFGGGGGPPGPGGPGGPGGPRGGGGGRRLGTFDTMAAGGRTIRDGMNAGASCAGGGCG